MTSRRRLVVILGMSALLVTACSGSGTQSVTAPTLTGTSVPAAAPISTMYYVWGGFNYSVYLGNFSCTFCTEYGAESINNESGTYGSPESSSSIKNESGAYGNRFSTYSPCNFSTTMAPKVYDSSRTTYFGILGGSPFTLKYLVAFSLWVKNDLCKH